MSASSPPPPMPDSAAGRPGSEETHAELLAELDRCVRAIRGAALSLKKAADGIQAVERNADRILASTRMLEINVSDLLRDPPDLPSWQGGPED